MKKFILVFAIIVISKISFSQTPPLSIRGFSNVENFFFAQYLEIRKDKIYSKLLDTLCQTGYSFVALTLSREGEIQTITVDNNTPESLKNVLIRIWEASNNKWVVIDSTHAKNINIVIPIIYNFFTQSKCREVKNNIPQGARSMMSVFNNSERGRIDGIERTKDPQNVWLFSPIYVTSPFR